MFQQSVTLQMGSELKHLMSMSLTLPKTWHSYSCTQYVHSHATTLFGFARLICGHTCFTMSCFQFSLSVPCFPQPIHISSTLINIYLFASLIGKTLSKSPATFGSLRGRAVHYYSIQTFCSKLDRRIERKSRWKKWAWQHFFCYWLGRINSVCIFVRLIYGHSFAREIWSPRCNSVPHVHIRHNTWSIFKKL